MQASLVAIETGVEKTSKAPLRLRRGPLVAKALDSAGFERFLEIESR
jgi:hypothetical protein